MGITVPSDGSNIKNAVLFQHAVLYLLAVGQPLITVSAQTSNILSVFSSFSFIYSTMND